jgi:hypothetical protein
MVPGAAVGIAMLLISVGVYCDTLIGGGHIELFKLSVNQGGALEV